MDFNFPLLPLVSHDLPEVAPGLDPSVHERKYIPPGVAGTAATIAEIQKLIAKGKRDKYVRIQIGKILNPIDGKRPCQPKDYFCYAKALYEFCRDDILYAYDPHLVEYVEEARVILQTRIGDCDSNSAILLASMLEGIGLECQLITIMADPSRPNEYSHIYIRVKIPRRGWIAADPTVPNKKFGWEAPGNFPKRYWHSSTDSLGQPVDQEATVTSSALGCAPCMMALLGLGDAAGRKEARQDFRAARKDLRDLRRVENRGVRMAVKAGADRADARSNFRTALAPAAADALEKARWAYAVAHPNAKGDSRAWKRNERHFLPPTPGQQMSGIHAGGHHHGRPGWDSYWSPYPLFVSEPEVVVVASDELMDTDGNPFFPRNTVVAQGFSGLGSLGAVSYESLISRYNQINNDFRNNVATNPRTAGSDVTGAVEDILSALSRFDSWLVAVQSGRQSADTASQVLDGIYAKIQIVKQRLAAVGVQSTTTPGTPAAGTSVPTQFVDSFTKFFKPMPDYTPGIPTQAERQAPAPSSLSTNSKIAIGVGVALIGVAFYMAHKKGGKRA